MTNVDPFEPLISRIAERLDALGLSERQASILATGRPDAIRYIRTRRAKPSLERILQLARVLKADPSYLYGHTNTNDFEGISRDLDVVNAMNRNALADLSELEGIEKTAPCFNSILGPKRSFRLVGSAQEVHISTNYTMPEIIHIFPMPQVLREMDMYIHQVLDQALQPIHARGSFVVVTQQAKVSVNDLVLVNLGPLDDGGMLTFLAQFAGRTKRVGIFRQFDPAIAFEVPASEIVSVERLVTYQDLIGAA